MKIAFCFLTFVTFALALPGIPNEASDELDWSKMVPNNIYVEPIDPVQRNFFELPGGRIIGGTEVAPNSIPYQLALLINGSYLCGGSLISPTAVLTAAHCTISAAFVEVRLGAHNVNTNEATQVRITSTNIRNHPNYSPITIANDIAIVLLPPAVVLNNNIRTIPLAPANAGSYDGSRALLSGWGKYADAIAATSPVLLSINLNIISNDACRNVFGSYILDSSICTSGAGGIGSCTGDSGGPLVVDGVQVGVVSFGSGGCEDGFPSAYARVSEFRDWIATNAGV